MLVYAPSGDARVVNKAVPLILAMALIAGLSSGIGCTPRHPAVIIELVPEEANSVACIQVNQILTDEDLIAAYEEAAVIFGDSESDDYFGAIVKGAFNPEAVLDSIEQAIGEHMVISTYRGYQIYEGTIKEYEWELALCFLSDGALVAGSMDAVKGVIHLAVGDAEPLSGLIAEVYNSLGDVYIKVAAELPVERIGTIPEEQAPIELALLEDIEAVGASFNKVADNISTQVRVCFSSPEHARTFETWFLGAITFIPLGLDIPLEATDMLDGIELTRSGSCIVISLTTTLTEIEELTQAID
jgi:hypothetical protein